jgi:3-oxoacyl-[acyl-carrier-protein] synthase II
VNEVVVTGVGAVTPLGVGAALLHERWAAGICGIKDGEGRCDEFEVTDHFSVKEARRADRFAQLVLVASKEALADAGWADGLPHDPRRIGAIIGTGIGGIGTIEANDHKLLEGGPKRVSPLAVPLMMGNAGAAAVSMRHGLKGPSYGVVSACAAGTHAIGSAMRAIQCGDATAVVAGGTEAALTPLSRAAFVAVEALSPTGISRPFDLRRDGFVMGEGAACPRARGRRRGPGARRANPRRAARLRRDLRCLPHHGTAGRRRGRRGGDHAGARGRRGERRRDRLRQRPRHLDADQRPRGDRGAENGTRRTRRQGADLLDQVGDRPPAGRRRCGRGVATILALRARVLPPTLGLEQPDPELDLDYVPLVARALELGKDQRAIAISNSFGFGGHNAVVCLEVT